MQIRIWQIFGGTRIFSITYFKKDALVMLPEQPHAEEKADRGNNTPRTYTYVLCRYGHFVPVAMTYVFGVLRAVIVSMWR